MGIKMIFSNKMGQVGLSKLGQFKARIKFKGALSNLAHIYLRPTLFRPIEPYTRLPDSKWL